MDIIIYMYVYIYIYAFVKKINEKYRRLNHLLNQKMYFLRAEYTYNLQKYFFHF